MTTGLQIAETRLDPVALRPQSSQRLAANGGSPAVRTRYRERWRKIGMSESLRVIWHMLRDINTQSGGGGAISEFEAAFARLVGVPHALAMNSGTAAIHSAYLAAGVGPGHEVIVPSYTFFASAAPVLQCGATPVFCDLNADTLTADPDDVERRITDRTRAICVVHVWGNPADLPRFREIADRRGLTLIEDCSHAHGASFDGRPVGSWGDVGCFSLQGAKPVSGGEAGIAVTKNATLYDRMLALGHYPRAAREQQAATLDIGSLSLGLKYRPHLYAVRLARGSLRRLDKLNRLRRHNYALLSKWLVDCPALSPVRCHPQAQRGGFLEFLWRYDQRLAGGWPREEFVEAVRAEGVPARVDRYAPLHREPLFCRPQLDSIGGAVNLSEIHPMDDEQLPATCLATQQLITLPAFTQTSPRFLRQCAEALRKVVGYAQQHPVEKI